MKSLFEYLCVFLFAVLASIAFIHFSSGDRQPPTETQVVRDTVYSIRPSKPIVITKYKARIVKISDTIVQSVPFTASIDTVIVHDTIRAEFAFPENLLSLEIRKAPDTAIIDRQIVTRTVEKREPWWRVPLYFITGAVAGYVLQSVK